jgi:hypothetical protein
LIFVPMGPHDTAPTRAMSMPAWLFPRLHFVPFGRVLLAARATYAEFGSLVADVRQPV